MVTTVFTPLMLVVGWYGMNFKYMPELEYKMSYPLVFASCIIISLLVLWFFRRKKWL
jgi:magnesium transporter